MGSQFNKTGPDSAYELFHNGRTLLQFPCCGMSASILQLEPKSTTKTTNNGNNNFCTLQQ